MLKGTNKQILEVTNTNSPYFEKIIFFVRPEGQSISEAQLKMEAECISKKMRKPPKQKKTAKQILQSVAYSFLGIGAGIALTFILNNFVK